MKRIVKFDGLDDGKFPDGFDADARELATALTPAIDARLGGGGVATCSHDFFGGLDVDSLLERRATQGRDRGAGAARRGAGGRTR